METTPTPAAPAAPAAPVQLDPLKEIKNKLTQEQKEAFFKAFLADKPYMASETLFDGKLSVKFSTLSIKQNNIIMQQMQYDREQNIAKNSDAYIIRVVQYRLASSLLEIDKTPFAKEITEETEPNNPKEGTTYLLKRLEIMKDWPVYKVSALTDAFNRFDTKVRALTEESFKSSF